MITAARWRTSRRTMELIKRTDQYTWALAAKTTLAANRALVAKRAWLWKRPRPSQRSWLWKRPWPLKAALALGAARREPPEMAPTARTAWLEPIRVVGRSFREGLRMGLTQYSDSCLEISFLLLDLSVTLPTILLAVLRHISPFTHRHVCFKNP